MTISDSFSPPVLTTRAMLDPTRLCKLRCSFCYYLHGDLESVKPWEKQKREVLDAVARGCTAGDLTGGDPLTNPMIVDFVRLCVENKISLRIISSLICPQKVLDDVMDAGVDDWLISLHGAKEETHNAIVHNYENGPVEKTKYRQIQVKRLESIMKRMQWCGNYVIIEKNQLEMADFARWVVSLPRPPHIINFLNFNPHYEWGSGKHKQEAISQIVDYRIAGPILDEAIDILEGAGIGVNCRYTPMCAVAERHRKNICNGMHNPFDGGEWENSIGGKTYADGVRYGKNLTNGNEEKNAPCNTCSHQWICGGANKIWHKLANEKFGCEVLHPLPVLAEGSDPNDFWMYRKENVLGLDPRVQGFRKLEQVS